MRFQGIDIAMSGRSIVDDFRGATMRGADVTQESMFSYATPGEFVPAEHPLRSIREILNTALRAMD